jgi:DNA-binding transcriptional MocR family regulator
MLLTYKKRYDTIIRVLKDKTPFLYFSEPNGGMNIWADSDLDSLILCSAAKQKGVIITSGNIFYLDNRKSNNIRICFAGVDEEEIVKGVNLIKDAYDDIQNYNSGNIFPLL